MRRRREGAWRGATLLGVGILAVACTRERQEVLIALEAGAAAFDPYARNDGTVSIDGPLSLTLLLPCGRSTPLEVAGVHVYKVEGDVSVVDMWMPAVDDVCAGTAVVDRTLRGISGQAPTTLGSQHASWCAESIRDPRAFGLDHRPHRSGGCLGAGIGFNVEVSMAGSGRFVPSLEVQHDARCLTACASQYERDGSPSSGEQEPRQTAQNGTRRTTEPDGAR